VSQHKNDESFKVIDRRMFTSEGDLRPEAAEQQKSEKNSPAAAPVAQPAANPAANSAANAAPVHPEGAKAPAPDTPAVTAETPAVSPSIQKLIDFIAQNAVVCLGVPDPRTGQRQSRAG
jgi:hypothetical protein